VTSCFRLEKFLSVDSFYTQDAVKRNNTLLSATGFFKFLSEDEVLDHLYGILLTKKDTTEVINDKLK
jgi:hypothetical protein